MPENPALAEQIAGCLRDEYGLHVESLSRLSLGADSSTSVYRAVTADRTSYFVKVKQGGFYDASVLVPHFLHAAGIRHVIPALAARTGQLWADLDPLTVLLYPFVEGQPGFEERMSQQQWFQYGAALKQIHTCTPPAELARHIHQESFSPRWGGRLKSILAQVEEQTGEEPVGKEAIDLLRSRKDVLLEIIGRTEQFARRLQGQPHEFILCHADIHGWNLFIDQAGALYIVDWDAVILAPKERDLMFIGGGHGDSGYSAREEEAMFYQGYGQTYVNQDAIAYYRYDRIFSDMVDDYELLFLAEKDEQERRELLDDMKSVFLPGAKLEMACRSDRVFHGK